MFFHITFLEQQFHYQVYVGKSDFQALFGSNVLNFCLLIQKLNVKTERST